MTLHCSSGESATLQSSVLQRGTVPLDYPYGQHSPASSPLGVEKHRSETPSTTCQITSSGPREPETPCSFPRQYYLSESQPAYGEQEQEQRYSNFVLPSFPTAAERPQHHLRSGMQHGSSDQEKVERESSAGGRVKRHCDSMSLQRTTVHYRGEDDIGPEGHSVWILVYTHHVPALNSFI